MTWALKTAKLADLAVLAAACMKRRAVRSAKPSSSQRLMNSPCGVNLEQQQALAGFQNGLDGAALVEADAVLQRADGDGAFVAELRRQGAGRLLGGNLQGLPGFDGTGGSWQDFGRFGWGAFGVCGA
ncbi:hypothetical protein [Ottowia beijingensis]|uniref:hypothetical protein n=1 Tax=Ottowia beijingensis TaxID=1207057 RepID=UPI00214D9AE9|nr:hypothetical protein [Ottowia beijingensis]